MIDTLYSTPLALFPYSKAYPPWLCTSNLMDQPTLIFDQNHIDLFKLPSDFRIIIIMMIQGSDINQSDVTEDKQEAMDNSVVSSEIHSIISLK